MEPRTASGETGPVHGDGDQTHASSKGNGDGAPPIKLADFVPIETLQEIQDSFTALTRLSTSIRDADGKPITEPTDFKARVESDGALDWLLDGDELTANGDRPLVAPIRVDGFTAGSIVVERHTPQPAQLAPSHIAALKQRLIGLGIAEDQLDAIVTAAQDCLGYNRAAGVQFLDLLAGSLSRLCYQEYQLRRRVDELSVLYNLATALSGHSELQQVMDTAARSAAAALQARSAMIRLLEAPTNVLMARSVHNLSREFLNKGPLLLDESELARAALREQVVYVEDMSQDARVTYPKHARREGVVSLLAAGMVYQDKPIGVVELFTAEKRRFSDAEVNLLKAIAQLLAAAIVNVRLAKERQESRRVQRQLQMARDVQHRMLPSKTPDMPPFDIAARYVPSFELGGDFYDFIGLAGHMGVVVGDVVGKGIAAGLLMASVRASIRAYAQDLYDLDEVISRANIAMCRDTLDNEFATLWYGVLDPKTLRLTYCNAGHEPPLLLRGDRLYHLDTGGMIVGVDRSQQYEKGIFDLQPGDVLLAYTDGLADAFNFDGERFGRDRIVRALRESASGNARDVMNHVLWEKRRFAGLNTATDDLTLVVIKVGTKVAQPTYSI